MKEKLLSILKDRKDKKGFTLIELLVVIAIIAILVVIVVVAINPAERLREAADRRAQSNVRASGTLLSTCVTRQNGDLSQCASISDVEDPTGGDGDVAVNTLMGVVGGATPTELCLYEQGRTTSTSTWYIYSTDDGSVNVATAVPTATTCPNP